MEVDKALADVLQEGQTVVVRGGEDDSAVLCTKDKVRRGIIITFVAHAWFLLKLDYLGVCKR